MVVRGGYGTIIVFIQAGNNKVPALSKYMYHSAIWNVVFMAISIIQSHITP